MCSRPYFNWLALVFFRICASLLATNTSGLIHATLETAIATIAELLVLKRSN